MYLSTNCLIKRQANTVGLVLERERVETEKDGLIWWVGNTQEVLYEDYFHCTDLGVQLKPVIERFRASDAFKTGIPNKEDGIYNYIQSLIYFSFILL